MSKKSFESSLQLECPVCFELPFHEVFQCKDGHTLCNICYEKLTECPQCRIPFGKEKIRCRAVEALLDLKSFPCQFKDQGCHVTEKRSLMMAHVNKCEFRHRTLFYCQCLGFNCDYKTNPLDIPGANAHFRKEHHALVVRQSYCEIKLQGLDQLSTSPNLLWTPVILHIGNGTSARYFLFEVFIQDENYLQLACIFMEDPLKQQVTNFRASFQILDTSGQMPAIKKDILPEAFTWAARIGHLAMWPITRVPLNLLKSYYVSSDNELSILIHIDLNADLTEDLQSLKLNAKSILVPAQEKSMQARAIVFICDECKSEIVDCTTYFCLQCDDYELCQMCMDKGKHPQHFFAMMKTNCQKMYLHMLQYCGKSGFKKILGTDENIGNLSTSNVKFFPNTCVGCGRFPILKAYYVCLLCPMAEICKECVDAGFHRQHIFGIVQSKKVEKFYQLQRAKRSAIISCWSGNLNLDE